MSESEKQTPPALAAGTGSGMAMLCILLLCGCHAHTKPESTAAPQPPETQAQTPDLSAGITNLARKALFLGYAMAKEGLPRNAMHDLWLGLNGDEAAEKRFSEARIQAWMGHQSTNTRSIDAPWKGPFITHAQEREMTQAIQGANEAAEANGYHTFIGGSGLWYQPLPGFRIVVVPDNSPNPEPSGGPRP